MTTLSGEDEGLEIEAKALKKVQHDHGNAWRVSRDGSGEQRYPNGASPPFTGIYRAITDSSHTVLVTLAGTTSSGPGPLHPA